MDRLAADNKRRVCARAVVGEGKRNADDDNTTPRQSRTDWSTTTMMVMMTWA